MLNDILAYFERKRMREKYQSHNKKVPTKAENWRRVAIFHFPCFGKRSGEHLSNYLIVFIDKSLEVS